MAERFYSNTSPLDSAVSGAMEGTKFKNDELYRKAQLDLQNKQLASQQGVNRENAAQYAATNFDGKLDPEYDDAGNLTGKFVPNQGIIDRDKPYLKKNDPSAFSTEISPAKSIPGASYDASGNVIPDQGLPKMPPGANPSPFPLSPIQMPPSGLTPSDGAGIKPPSNSPINMPNSGLPEQMPVQAPTIKPLLDPMAGKPGEKTSVDAKLASQADSIVPGAKQYLGKDENGKDIYKSDVAKESISFDQPLTAVGDVKKPAVNEELDPSPYLQAALQKKLTSNLHDPVLSTVGWPKEMRDMFGLKDGENTNLPASVVRGFMDATIRAKSMMGIHGMDSEAATFADKLQKGDFLNADQAIKAFEDSVGRPAYPREVSLIEHGGQAAVGQQKIGIQQDQFNKNFDFKSSKEVNNALSGYVKQVMTSTKDEQTALKSAQEIDDVLANPDTRGRATQMKFLIARMIAPQRMSNMEAAGLTGVNDIAGRLEQMVSNLSGDGITDDNKQLFSDMARQMRDATKQSVRNKTSGFMGPAIRTLMSRGYSQEAATQAAEQVLDVEHLTNYSTSGGAPSPMSKGGSQQRNQPARGQPVSHAPKDDQEPVKDVASITSEMRAALQTIDSLPPEQKAIKRQKLEKRFLEKTGKAWGSVQ